MGKFFRDVFIALIVVPLAIFIPNLFHDYSSNSGNPRIYATTAQVKAYSSALAEFKRRFHALPGDMPNAGEKIVGYPEGNGSNCNPAAQTAGDSIIGNPDFIKSLKPQVIGKTRIPAAAAADETVLFWNHLLLDNLIGGVTMDGVKNDSDVAFGTTMPEAKSGGGFIVGYSDGTPVPETLAPPNEGFKGTVLVQTSKEVLEGKAEPNTPSKQALLPLRAAQIDRKMDDGAPTTGLVRGYGAPTCFIKEGERYAYDEKNRSLDCGLIYLIDKQP